MASPTSTGPVTPIFLFFVSRVARTPFTYPPCSAAAVWAEMLGRPKVFTSVPHAKLTSRKSLAASAK
jgi:hypothetical protein